jgi:hypothetical protein
MTIEEQEQLRRDWEDNSISLYTFCKKWNINLKEIFPDIVEDEEKYEKEINNKK